MRIKLWHQIAISSLIALSCAGQAWSRAEVFSDLSLEQAQQQAKTDGKFLLIDFMATWCPPCKQMEKSTWTNDSVQQWIKDNAIAIQFDVDKDEKVSSDFKIEAMPTLVLFTPASGSKEFARQVGGLSPSELLQWLNAAKSGKTAEEAEKQANVDTDVMSHVSNAHELQSAGKSAEAFDEYLWLWNNIDKADSEYADLRISLVPSEMKNIVLAYPAAKAKVSALRDAADKAGNRHDWMLLNGALDDNARTLAWFDKSKTDPTQRETIKANIPLLEGVLFSHSRWADAASYLYPQPLDTINEYYKRADKMKHPGPDTEVSKDFDPFPSMVLLVYGAYVGAGREAEAQKIADECFRLDNTPAMHESLTNMAKSMRQARVVQHKTTK